MTGLLLAFTLVAAPQVLQSGSGRAGERVRLVATSDSAHPVVGTLAAAEGGLVSIRVTDAGTAVTLPSTGVASLEVSRGTSLRAGAKKGFLVGLGAGAILLAGTIDDASDIEKPLVAIISILIVPIPFAVAGALLEGERWERVSVLTSGNTSVGSPSIRFGVGEHVRAATSMGMRSGFDAKSTSDSLILSDGTRLPWRDVSAVSVQAGRDRTVSTILGGMVGLVAGIAAAAGSPSPDGSANDGGVILTTAGGAILGRKFLPIRKWVSLPVPR